MLGRGAGTWGLRFFNQLICLDKRGVIMVLDTTNVLVSGVTGGV